MPLGLDHCCNMNSVPLASIKRLFSVPICCVLPEDMISGLAMQGKPVALSRGATVTELNVCRSRRCRTFDARIGRIMKTYDYINRVDITLLLSVYEDTLSPLVDMHHLDRSCVIVGFFLKLLRSPAVASEPGLCVAVI